MRRYAWAIAVVALAAATGCPPAPIVISKPAANALADDPAIAIELSVPRRFVLDASVVRIDGVDLIAALGLVPPFDDASGLVAIGPDTIAVSDFDYVIPASGRVVIRAMLAGLPSADHLLEAEALPAAGGAPTIAPRAFAVVEPMTLEASAIASSGTPPPPFTPGPRMGNATLGESLAGPPVPLAGGGTLRPGYVPSAHAKASAP